MSRSKQKSKSSSKDTTRAASKAAPKATAQGLSTPPLGPGNTNPPWTAASPITSSAVSKVPSNAVCYLLGVPIEIRLNIYCFLLVEPVCASLYSNYWSEIYGAYEAVVGKWEERYERSRKLRAQATVRREPTILQTNSQIYSEASSMLYSGLQLIVRPGDALMKNGTRTSAVKGKSTVWRHLPSHGLGRKGADGLTRYKESNRKGAMEPHVFTRFEKVRYEADFNFLNLDDEAAPVMYIDKDLHISEKDEYTVISYFKNPTACRLPAIEIIQESVNLLSKSPLITVLEFALSVEIIADDGFDNDSKDDTFPQGEAKDREKQEVVNKRAYELMLENGVLEPLRQLTNVKIFAFDFALPGSIPEYEVFQPQQKHIDIIEDLKATIEHNWWSSRVLIELLESTRKARLPINLLGGFVLLVGSPAWMRSGSLNEFWDKAKERRRHSFSVTVHQPMSPSRPGRPM